jgi:hypothetical protein
MDQGPIRQPGKGAASGSQRTDVSTVIYVYTNFRSHPHPHPHPHPQTRGHADMQTCRHALFCNGKRPSVSSGTWSLHCLEGLQKHLGLVQSGSRSSPSQSLARCTCLWWTHQRLPQCGLESMGSGKGLLISFPSTALAGLLIFSQQFCTMLL